MTRKYSSTSASTTLAAGINSTATSITVVTGTGSSLMGGVTLAAGNVDSFGIAIDVDTINEEIVWVTNVSGDTLTIVRAKAGTTGISHTAGASIKHVLTGDDATFFTAGVTTADAAIPKSIVTAKGDVLVGVSSGVVDNLPVGTNGQILAADTAETLGVKWTNTLASPVLTGTVTAGGAVGTSGQVLASTGTGVQWTSVSAGYTAPTIGSTLINSGATVTTIAGLTLTAPTLTGTVTASGDINLSATNGPGSIKDQLTLILMNAL